MIQSPYMTLAHAIVDDVTQQHSDVSHAANQSLRAAIGKIVCIGRNYRNYRNYAAHAQELGNAIPESPLLFMEPASSVVSMRSDIVRPDATHYGDTHYEAELCIQLAADLSNATVEQAEQAIGGVSLGLDLTLRDMQTELKQKGHPWERAKCFDGACVLADWVDAQVFGDFSNVPYQLYVNNVLFTAFTSYYVKVSLLLNTVKL